MKKAKKNPLREALAEVKRLKANAEAAKKIVDEQIRKAHEQRRERQYAREAVDRMSQELNRIAQEQSEEIGKDYGVRVHVRTTISME